MQPSCSFLRRWRPRPEPLAWFALAGVVLYVGIDVLLAFLRPRYSLLYNAESDYGRGPWSWLMDLNFLLRCALSLALAGALAQAFPGRVRGGLGLLVTWAVCSGLLAFCADDPKGYPATLSGRIHLVLAFVAFTAMAAGAIVISASLRSGLPSIALPLSIAAAVAYLLLGVAARHRHAPGGLYERIFLGLELLWIAVVAARIATGRIQMDVSEAGPDPSITVRTRRAADRR
jgi:hypothetical membrane protein